MISTYKVIKMSSVAYINATKNTQRCTSVSVYCIIFEKIFAFPVNFADFFSHNSFFLIGF